MGLPRDFGRDARRRAACATGREHLDSIFPHPPTLKGSNCAVAGEARGGEALAAALTEVPIA